MRRLNFVLFTVVLLFVLAVAVAILPALAAPKSVEAILETSPPGFTNGGDSIVPIDLWPGFNLSFVGARFTITSRTHVTAVGGHIKGYCDTDRSLFIAIVPIGTDNLLPDVRLTGAVYATVVEAPCNETVGPYPFQVPDTLVETRHLVLHPGEYVIVIGSGLFGATGSGWMPIANQTFGAARFVRANSLSDRLQDVTTFYDPLRFVIEGFAVGHGRK